MFYFTTILVALRCIKTLYIFTKQLFHWPFQKKIDAVTCFLSYLNYIELKYGKTCCNSLAYLQILYNVQRGENRPS